MGDPACWLGQLCPDCAAVLDDATATRCPRCGRALPPPTQDRSPVEQGDGDVDDA